MFVVKKLLATLLSSCGAKVGSTQTVFTQGSNTLLNMQLWLRTSA